VEEILTAGQVAELLQVHLKTVYKLARKGHLPGRKLGGGWRFSKSQIMEMVLKNEKGFSVERTRNGD
jgi:excisionase family DNA binding protein